MAKYASWQTPEFRAGLQDFSSRLLGLAQRQVLPAGQTRGSLMAAALPEALKASRGAALRERERKKYDLEMEALERQAKLDEAKLQTQAELANYFQNPSAPRTQLTPAREELIPAAETPYPRVGTLGGAPDVIGPIGLQAQAAMTSPFRTVPATYSGYGGGAVDPRLMALQSKIDPGEAVKTAIAQQTTPYPIESDVFGTKRYTSGPQRGEKVYPGVLPKMETSAGQAATDIARLTKFHGSSNHPVVLAAKAKQRKDARSLTDESSMRGQFKTSSNDFVKVRDAYNRVKVLAEDATGASDMGLIFNIMKMFDPGSVVRESEFATASTSGSIPSRGIAALNRVVSGKRLDVRMRKDFAEAAERLMIQQTKAHLLLEGEFTGIAQRADINPKDVVIDYIGNQTFRKTVLGTSEETQADIIKGLEAHILKLESRLTPNELRKETVDLAPPKKANLRQKYNF